MSSFLRFPAVVTPVLTGGNFPMFQDSPAIPIASMSEVPIRTAWEALALWRLVAVVSDHLREPGEHVEALLALHTEQPRRLALWASGLLIVAVSIGALYGPLVGRWAERLSAAGG